MKTISDEPQLVGKLINAHRDREQRRFITRHDRRRLLTSALFCFGVLTFILAAFAGFLRLFLCWL